MEECYEIVPGESIGPFRLGMTREDVEGLNIHPMELFEDGSGAAFTLVGVRVYYDESGRCKKIEARVFGSDKGAARFTLAGHDVDNVSDREAKELFRSISPDIRSFYGGFALPSAGLRAVKWENSDDFIFAIVVERPRERET
jgi:hypothetical protein